jgi:hypothetical protein
MVNHEGPPPLNQNTVAVSAATPIVRELVAAADIDPWWAKWAGLLVELDEAPSVQVGEDRYISGLEAHAIAFELRLLESGVKGLLGTPPGISP